MARSEHRDTDDNDMTIFDIVKQLVERRVMEIDLEEGSPAVRLELFLFCFPQAYGCFRRLALKTGVVLHDPAPRRMSS